MLQTSRLPDMDVPVKPQSFTADKQLQEMQMLKEREVKEFNIENESKVEIMKNKSEVWNISVCKIFFTQNS
jgi:hypothetical protein